jgi:Domain of unknown function (DUF1707)
MDDMLRAADRDRDAVAEILRENYAQGRLTRAEFDERCGAAVGAKTMGDLRALTVDLPVPAPASARTAAWSPARMRLITVAGVVAALVILGLAVLAGRFVFAWPAWLVILVAVRLVHGRRRSPHRGDRRSGRL